MALNDKRNGVFMDALVNKERQKVTNIVTQL